VASQSSSQHFTPNAESVRRIEEVSTNAYLTYDLVIEKVLKGVDYFRGSHHNIATLYGSSLEWRFGH
jgi:hypothetical protein